MIRIVFFALTIIAATLAPLTLLAQHNVEFIFSDNRKNFVDNVYVDILQADISVVSNSSGRAKAALRSGTYFVRINHISYREIALELQVSKDTTVRMTLEDLYYRFDEVELISSWVREGTPMTVYQMDKEEIARNNMGQDVPFLLQWTPSVIATSDAGAGIGYTGISIRGSDPTRINISINGVPLNDSESQGVFWVNMPDFSSSVDAVQIQRGVGSSTNGSVAFGATVNLSTNQISEKPFGNVNLGMGSFNTRRASISAGSGMINGKFNVEGRLSMIESDGYIDRASSALRSANISATYLGKKSSLKFHLFSGSEQTYQAWNGLPYQYSTIPDLRTYNSAGARSDGSFYENEIDNYRQDHYQLIHHWQVNPSLLSSITLHYTRGHGYFEQFRENDRLSRYKIDPIQIGTETITRSDLIRRRWLDNHFAGFIYTLDHQKAGSPHRVTYGLNYNEYLGDHFGRVIWARFAGNSEYQHQYYFNDARKTDFSSFIKYYYQINQNWSLFADMQFRHVNYTFAGDNNAGWSFDDAASLSFFNPKAGIFYQNSRKENAYLSFSHGSREPNRTDFTNTSENSRPKPEFLYNLELGWNKKGSFWYAGANYYMMYYRDQLALSGQINDVGAYTRVNVPESYRTGVELELAFDKEFIYFRSAATFSINKIIEFTEFVDDWDEGTQQSFSYRNADLALSPGIIAYGEIGWRTPHVNLGKHVMKPELSLLVKYVGKQYLDNTSDPNAALDPYSFTDLRISFPLFSNAEKRLEFRIWVNNLLDNQYFSNGWVYKFISNGYNPVNDDPYSRMTAPGVFNQTGLFPQAGRNWLVGLQYYF